MSSIAELFPRLRECLCATPDAAPWNKDMSMASKADVQFVLNLIDEYTQSAVDQPSPDLLEITTALAADLGPLAVTDTIPNAVVMLVRMVTASIAVDCATHRKQFSVARDWILYAVTGRFEDSNAVELENIDSPAQALLECSPATEEFARRPFLICALGLYYYSRVTGDLKNLAASYLDLVERLCKAKPDELAIETLAYAGTWAVANNNDRGAPILRYLNTMYETISLAPDVRLQLAITLSCGVGGKIGLDTAKIAETTLATLNTELHAFDRLQLLSNACAGNLDKIIALLSEIESAVKTYSTEIGSDCGNRLLAGFEKDRSFDVIAPLVCKLAAAGRVEDAFRLLRGWRGVNAGTKFPKVMFLLGTWYKGVAFAIEKRLLITKPADISDSLLELTSAGNTFFGTNVVVRDDDRFNPHEAPRIGIPDGSSKPSEQYEKAISQHFRFDLATDLIREATDVEGIVVIPRSREPVQAVMLKIAGATLPIVASCAEPQTDRPIAQVCIWCGGTYYGELERRWVTEAFERRRIQVIAPSDKSQHTFRDFYSSPKFDLFWMIGHGQFDHYNPENMSVDLSETETLRLSDWMDIDFSQTSGRRLFVANFCDSGTTAMLGGTGELGLPMVLARDVQALVAHLWPVSSMHAAVFGAVLALQLCNSAAFFKAYCDAVKLMMSGRAAVEAELVRDFGEGHEIIDRIRGASNVWENLFVWGSPAFFC